MAATKALRYSYKKKNGYLLKSGSSFPGSAMRKRVSKYRGGSCKKKNGYFLLHKLNGLHQYHFLYQAAMRKRAITTFKKHDIICSFQSHINNDDDIKTTRKEGCNKGSMDDQPQERKRFWTKPRRRVILPTQKFRFTVDLDQDLSDSDFLDEEEDDVKTTREEGCNKGSMPGGNVEEDQPQERRSVERFWTKPRCRVILPTEKFRFTIDLDEDLSDSDFLDPDEDQDC